MITMPKSVRHYHDIEEIFGNLKRVPEKPGVLTAISDQCPDQLTCEIIMQDVKESRTHICLAQNNVMDSGYCSDVMIVIELIHLPDNPYKHHGSATPIELIFLDGAGGEIKIDATKYSMLDKPYSLPACEYVRLYLGRWINNLKAYGFMSGKPVKEVLNVRSLPEYSA
jgi:hypothetical protein